MLLIIFNKTEKAHVILNFRLVQILEKMLPLPLPLPFQEQIKVTFLSVSVTSLSALIEAFKALPHTIAYTNNVILIFDILKIERVFMFFGNL